MVLFVRYPRRSEGCLPGERRVHQPASHPASTGSPAATGSTGSTVATGSKTPSSVLRPERPSAGPGRPSPPHAPPPDPPAPPSPTPSPDAPTTPRHPDETRAPGPAEVFSCHVVRPALQTPVQLTRITPVRDTFPVPTRAGPQPEPAGHDPHPSPSRRPRRRPRRATPRRRPPHQPATRRRPQPGGVLASAANLTSASAGPKSVSGRRHPCGHVRQLTVHGHGVIPSPLVIGMDTTLIRVDLRSRKQRAETVAIHSGSPLEVSDATEACARAASSISSRAFAGTT